MKRTISGDCPIWRSDTREPTADSIILDMENMLNLVTKER